MKTVHKYPVGAADIISVSMPRGAVPLHFGMQGSQLCLWAQVDTEQRLWDLHRFRMAGTGHPIEPEHAGRYVNTLQVDVFVFHFFHIIEESA